MGSVRKRGSRYRAEVRRKGFYRSQEFRTKAGADAWVTQIEAEYIAGKRGEPTRRTLAEALRRYAKEVSPRKRGERWETIRLTKLERDLGSCASLPLPAVRPADIAAWRDRRLALVTEPTVAREWNLLRSVFSVARKEWEWITDNPLRDLQRPQAGRPRERRVTPDELTRIVATSGYSGGTPTMQTHRVVLAFELAIETGMRAGEIRSIEARQVDLRLGVVKLTRTKNGDDRDVPLSARAREILRLLWRDDGPFLPMTAATMDSTFRKLRQRSKIEGLHFHDSRAEAATRLARKVDMLTLARILGHRNPKSLMIYYRESAADIAARLG